ncbi:MAG TPA: exopolysaccharide biosynthesis polyprenyl glycosylphosphotransferase [Candidatus Saccharimonadales bacterium]|nr:exopolysaccharide biosynthesis polyprenyl glycosylphosphotransferase [Candidatus Saccharimonadales bacterium]
MKSNASLVYGLVLIVGDFLALVAAFVAAYLLRSHFSHKAVAHPIAGMTYLHIFLLLLPFWILLFALLGLYNNSIQEKRFVELGRLLIGSFIGLLFVTSYAYFSNHTLFPAKRVPIYGFGLAFIFLAGFRNFARAVRAWLYKYDIGVTNLLLIGNTRITVELIEFLDDYRVSGYRIVGVIADKTQALKRYPHLAVFDSFEEATRRLKPEHIHGIVQTELYAAGARNNEILDYAQTNHISYRFVPGNSELFVGNIAVELFRSSIPVIAVHQTALIGWGRVVKRFLDILVSLILLVPGIPIMLIIAIVIKLSDLRAPIFFKDPRLTRFGSLARIYKFRSHKRAFTDLTPEQAFAKLGQPGLIQRYRAGGDKIPNDPRISRIGGFLRRTSLDELPQLINIFKGDISFVGPRALQPQELEQHAKKDLILAVKSGLTGLAQVSGRKDLPVPERRKLDLYYVQNWSLWLDLTIMVKTIRVVLNRILAGKVD